MLFRTKFHFPARSAVKKDGSVITPPNFKRQAKKIKAIETRWSFFITHPAMIT